MLFLLYINITASLRMTLIVDSMVPLQAYEMAMWAMLGQRPVAMCHWESFGKGWFGDAKSHLKLENVTEHTAEYGSLPDFSKVPSALDPTLFLGITMAFCLPWNAITLYLSSPLTLTCPKPFLRSIKATTSASPGTALLQGSVFPTLIGLRPIALVSPLTMLPRLPLPWILTGARSMSPRTPGKRSWEARVPMASWF